MNKLCPENDFYLELYQKAFDKVKNWQAKADKAEDGSPAWQIALQHRNNYALVVNWLSNNSPSELGYPKPAYRREK